MNEGVLSIIGGTPLVKLTRAIKDCHFTLFAKMEGHNPGGSIKDRAALNLIKRGIATGEINAATTVIESSSGNVGIGLAQTCAYYGLRFICVVDPKTTAHNIRLLQTYGAEVDLVEESDPNTGEFLQARLDRVQVLLGTIPNSFWPDQYSNIYNSLAHHLTMREIAVALDGEVDYLFCATSTCGTLRGCAEYIRDNRLKTKIIAVDAVGSVIFGGQRAKRLVPGHGAAVIPKLYQAGLADRFIYVSDLDCVVNCRRLVRHEAILAGGSSGAVLAAVERTKNDIPAGSTCVGILADRGDRYLDTIYSDSWVRKHFGDVSHLWGTAEEAQACLTVAY
jgi:cysteine synthase A